VCAVEVKMEIIGPNWPTVELLREELAGVKGTIAWARTVKGVFGGSPRIWGTKQLERLRSAGLKDRGLVSLKVPEFTEDIEEAAEWAEKGRKVLGRRNSHMQGRDIVVAEVSDLQSTRKYKKWLMSDYWVVWVPSNAEWRIHVFDGLTIARGMKVVRETKSAHEWIRTRRRGWVMVHNIEPPVGMRLVAKKAVEAVGYDWGAVDVLVQGSGGLKEFVVLEVNRAPGMKEGYTLEKYVEAFKKWSRQQQGGD